MRRVLLVVAVMGLPACNSILGIGGFQLSPADAGQDAFVPQDAPKLDGLGAMCMGSGLLNVCFDPPSTDVILGAGTLDTDTDARCLTRPQPSGGTVCTIVGSNVTVTGTVIVTGSRPLVIIATTMITIANAAVLDVSSTTVAPIRNGPAAGLTPCATGTDGTAVSSNGGAGASFSFNGGAGGRGKDLTVTLPGPVVGVTSVRGGCAGGTGAGNQAGLVGGVGGAGGGAVYLIAAASIVVTGNIYASGAGGAGGLQRRGGGGGGSGGLIGLEAPTITVTGTVTANGGGGGGGGGATTASLLGDDGTTYSYNVSAQGGARVQSNGAIGGNGASVSSPNGNAGGNNANYGAGGGGGSVGLVWVKGAITGNKISPSPTLH
jgi:hypothetical protein